MTTHLFKYIHSEKRGWELLSIAASIKAQKLAATAQGNITVLRESQSFFVTSARYISKAHVLFIQQLLKQVWPESIQLWSSDGRLQALLEHLSDRYNQCGR